MNIFARWMIFHPIKNFGNLLILAYMAIIAFIVYWLFFSVYTNPARCFEHILNATYFTEPSNPVWFMRIQKPFWMMAVIVYVGLELCFFLFDGFCWTLGAAKRLGKKYQLIFWIALAVLVAHDFDLLDVIKEAMK